MAAEFRVIQPAESRERWARFRREEAERVRAMGGPDPEAPREPPANLRAVLDLNGVRYAQFRRILLRAGPLDPERGLELEDTFLRTVRAATAGPAGRPGPEYLPGLRRLAVLLWRVLEPGSMPLRALRRIGLVRNPLRWASEAELRDLTLFCLGCRTSSAVGFPSPTTPRRPGGRTSSTTSESSPAFSPAG